MKKLPENHAIAPAPACVPISMGRSLPLSVPKSAVAKTTSSERLRSRAVAGLGKRAGGFVTREVKTTYEIDASGERAVKNEVVTQKQNPPDLAAIIFTLTNLDGQTWLTKPGVENSASVAGDEQPDLSSVPEDVLRDILKYFPATAPDKPIPDSEQ